MTELVTIRLRRPKSELLKKSGGNLNRWLNGLIDQALDAPAPIGTPTLSARDGSFDTLLMK